MKFNSNITVVLSCMLLACILLCINMQNVSATFVSYYSTQQVEQVLDGKKQHLKQVQWAILENNLESEASELFGKANPLQHDYMVNKQIKFKELMEKKAVLEFEIDNIQKILATKLAINEMANSTILTTSQAVRFYQEIINQVRLKPLKLIYKGSRDGFQSKQFHLKCDNQGPTVTIVKADTGAIFGGYTSASWNGTSYQFSYSESAFLFSLVSNSGEDRFKKIKQFAPPFSTDKGRSIYSHPTYGPTFGGGHDLHIISNAHENTGSYGHPNTYDFKGTDYLAGSYKDWFVKEIEIYTL